MDPDFVAAERLGLSYINIAQNRGRKQHARKEHLGRMVQDGLAYVLFDKFRTGETIAALWDIERGNAQTSEILGFGLGMLYDWDWRAEAVRASMDRLAPGLLATAPDAQIGSMP